MSNADHDTPRSKPGLIERLRMLFGMNGASVREDIEDALDDTSTQDAFTPQERLLLKNVLSLHELRIYDVMVPRADIIAISIGVGMIPLVSDKFFQFMPKALSPLLHSGILLASISAVALNLYFNGMRSADEAARDAAASASHAEAG